MNLRSFATESFSISEHPMSGFRVRRAMQKLARSLNQRELSFINSLPEGQRNAAWQDMWQRAQQETKHLKSVANTRQMLAQQGGSPGGRSYVGQQGILSAPGGTYGTNRPEPVPQMRGRGMAFAETGVATNPLARGVTGTSETAIAQLPQTNARGGAIPRAGAVVNTPAPRAGLSRASAVLSSGSAFPGFTAIREGGELQRNMPDWMKEPIRKKRQAEQQSHKSKMREMNPAERRASSPKPVSIQPASKSKPQAAPAKPKSGLLGKLKGLGGKALTAVTRGKIKAGAAEYTDVLTRAFNQETEKIAYFNAFQAEVIKHAAEKEDTSVKALKLVDKARPYAYRAAMGAVPGALIGSALAGGGKGGARAGLLLGAGVGAADRALQDLSEKRKFKKVLKSYQDKEASSVGALSRKVGSMPNIKGLGPATEKLKDAQNAGRWKPDMVNKKLHSFRPVA